MSTSAPIIFDIETGPLPVDVLKAILPPFDPASLGKHPGVFDPASVKLGNVKDPAKVEAKISESAAKHAAEVTDYEKRLAEGEPAHWQRIVDSAALSAVTGEVLAIGLSGKTDKIICQDLDAGIDEQFLLEHWWKIYRDARGSQRKLVGWNSKNFDVQFLVQRSFILGVAVPDSILTPTGYLNPIFVDLREIWLSGNKFNAQPGMTTLDTVGRALRLGGKMEGVTGADFARLFSDPETRPQAIEYLRGDIALTRAIAERFGVA